MFLWMWKNFSCWKQGYHHCMPERGFCIWVWVFLFHCYPTKTSATPGEKVVWLEGGMLLIIHVKHTACEKHCCGSSDHQHHRHEHVQPHSPELRCPPQPGGGEGRKQLEHLFHRGAWFCQERGRTSERCPRAAGLGSLQRGIPAHPTASHGCSKLGQGLLSDVHSLEHPDCNCKNLTHSL